MYYVEICFFPPVNLSSVVWLSPIDLTVSLLRSAPQAFSVAAPAADLVKVISTSEPPASRPAVAPTQPVTTAAPSKPGPTLVKVRACISIPSVLQ